MLSDFENDPEDENYVDIDDINDLYDQVDFWGVDSLTEDQQLLLGFT